MPKELTATRAVQATPIRVSLPADVAYDFNKFQKVQKDILGRLGCLACCSGWDIRWDIFRDFRVDEKLNVEQGFFR
jgi:hypothetical protein